MNRSLRAAAALLVWTAVCFPAPAACQTQAAPSIRRVQVLRGRGQVEIETMRQIVVAPSDAVFATPDGPTAYRERDGKLERVRVVLGKRNATSIEIKSGLAAGDRVSRIDPEAP